jgi:hypothetical protein
VVASSERLASGGGHLCTNGSPAATTTSTPSGSPAETTTSATDSLTSGSDHLCAGQPPQRWRPPQHARHGKEVLASVPPTRVRTRPSKPWSWEHGGRRCLRSGRDRVAEVCLLHKAGEHPFPPNAGGRGGHQPMWEAKPRLISLPTTARLINILEAKYRWKSAAPTRPRTSNRGKTRSVAPTR